MSTTKKNCVHVVISYIYNYINIICKCFSKFHLIRVNNKKCLFHIIIYHFLSFFVKRSRRRNDVFFFASKFFFKINILFMTTNINWLIKIIKNVVNRNIKTINDFRLINLNSMINVSNEYEISYFSINFNKFVNLMINFHLSYSKSYFFHLR